jgi:hypothetical protein
MGQVLDNIIRNCRILVGRCDEVLLLHMMTMAT